MVDLETLVKNTKIFVDTCAFMHEKADTFFLKKLQPVLLSQKRQIIVPRKVVQEIEKLAGRSGAKVSARRGKGIIEHYMRNGVLDVRGEAGDPFPDNLFQYVFTKFHTRF